MSAIIAVVTGGFAYHCWTLSSESVRFGTINRDGSVSSQSLGRTVYQQITDLQTMVDEGHSGLQGQLDSLKAKHRVNIGLIVVSAAFILTGITCATIARRKQSNTRRDRR